MFNFGVDPSILQHQKPYEIPFLIFSFTTDGFAYRILFELFSPIPGRVSCLKTRRKSRSFHMESECHKWFLSLPLGLFVGFVLVLVVLGVNLTPKNSIWWQTEPNKNLEQRTWNLTKSLYFSLNPQRNPQRKQKLKTGMKCSNRYCTMNIRNKLKNH